MNDFFDIYTIVFLALAVFIIFRLRSVLGQRTGNERPPQDPFRRPEPPTQQPPAQTPPESNVVPMPGVRPANEAAVAPAPAPAPNPLDGVPMAGEAVADGLRQLIAAEQSFDPREFVGGARAAYEMIVMAFARGDRKTLKDLLSKDVFDGFSSAITGREQRGEKAEATFVSLDKAEIIDAGLRGKTMNVTVRFVSKLINVTRDAAGKVVDGSPDTIVDVVDLWTFARDAGSRDPNWRLVSTESDN